MKKKFNDKGLTLIEIIVTLAVLGIIVSPLMSMFITSQKINNASNNEYQAIQLAQKYMESIKSQNTFNKSGYDEEIKDDGEVIYTKDVLDDDFISEVKLIQKPISIPGTDIDSYPKLLIKNNSVEFGGNIIPIENTNVNITINTGQILIEDTAFSYLDGIYVSIETTETEEGVSPETKLYFINCTEEGKIFLIDNGNKWSATYSGGEKPEIIPVKKSNTIEILYDIEVKVYKDSKNDSNLVTTLESTNIFK